MPKIIISHGTMGSPQGNWFPWISKQLRDRDFSVIVPEYPTPEGQTLTNWLATFDRVAGALGPDTILIGHSIGAVFVLRLLERINQRLRGAYLISGFTGRLGNAQYDKLNASFVDGPYNWTKIRKTAACIRVISGTDDPYVPASEAEGLAQALGVPLTSIHGGGHLNSESGFLSFDYLFNDILELESQAAKQEESSMS